MIELVINLNDVNKRLDSFLLKQFSAITRAMIYKYIRTNQIKVNGHKPVFNYRLQRNDVIKIYAPLSVESKPTFTKTNTSETLDVLYEDDNILVINKPIGIISQPNDSEQVISMQSLVLNYLYQTNQYFPETENSFAPSICHRLDRNTAGLMFAAKNAVSLAEMNRIMKEHEVIKTYLCLVHNIPKVKKASLKAFHYKDTQRNLVYINKDFKPGYKEIITEYEILDQNQKYALLKINLVTGRTHQIRAHLNFIGHPIVGEQKYKPAAIQNDPQIKYQALVCYQMMLQTSESSPLAYLNNKVFTLKHI